MHKNESYLRILAYQYTIIVNVNIYREFYIKYNIHKTLILEY